jgi:hypothetical protein
VLSRYGWDGQPRAHGDVADIGDPQSFQCLWLMLAVSLLNNIAQGRVRGSSARRFVHCREGEAIDLATTTTAAASVVK